jgi:2-amino-4-hydroxy-6-hydroxymethyldihydropteridine diphosphokinase
MSDLVLIGLGSNLGDRKALLDGAVEALGATPEIHVRCVSPYHESRPVGGPPGQGPFLNAAAALETSLDPFALLHRLQAIEAESGRVRTVHWGARTLDLDLLLYRDRIIDTSDLIVPHLRMAVRRFVLAPMAEIAPHLVDPLTRRSLEDLLANLDRRPGVLALTGDVGDPTFLERLARELGAVSLVGSPRASVSDSWYVSWPQRYEGWLPDTLRRMAHLRGEIDRVRNFNDMLAQAHERYELAEKTGRWLLTDLEFLRSFCWLVGRSSFPESTELWRTVQPSFIAVSGEEAEQDLLAWTSRYHPEDPIGRCIPRLRLRGVPDREEPRTRHDEARVSEILAACAATRA